MSGRRSSSGVGAIANCARKIHGSRCKCAIRNSGSRERKKTRLNPVAVSGEREEERRGELSQMRKETESETETGP